MTKLMRLAFAMSLLILATLYAAGPADADQVRLDLNGDISFGPQNAPVAVVSYISLGCAACKSWLDVFHKPLLAELEKSNVRHVIKLIAGRDDPAETINEALAAGAATCSDTVPAETKMKAVAFFLDRMDEWLRDREKVFSLSRQVGSTRECTESRAQMILPRMRDEVTRLDAANVIPEKITYPVSAYGRVEGNQIVVQTSALTGTAEGATQILSLIRPPAPTDPSAYQAAIEAAVAQDSMSWQLNRYLPGTLRATAVDQVEFLPLGVFLTTVDAEYRYQSPILGDQVGTVRAVFRDDKVYCLTYFDTPGTCIDPVSHAILHAAEVIEEEVYEEDY